MFKLFKCKNQHCLEGRKNNNKMNNKNIIKFLEKKLVDEFEFERGVTGYRAVYIYNKRIIEELKLKLMETK
jgi:hypothetical protein